MDFIRRIRENQGLTLVELTFAMAIFAIVLGATAQALISYYSSMDLQEQRAEAAQNLQSLLGDMREFRDANAANFPAALIQRWPNGENAAGAGTLPNERIRVTYLNPNGGAVAAANPIEVTVTSQWRTLRGNQMQISMSTLLTDR